MSAKIQKGIIQIYRVFDIAEEILLSKAEKILMNSTEGPRLKLPTDIRKAIIIKEAPLRIKLGQTILSLPEGEYQINAFAKLWDYGVMSIRFELPMKPNISWEELIRLSAQLETVPEIQKLSENYKNILCNTIKDAMVKPSSYNTAEDYITYIIEKADGIEHPKQFIRENDVSELILAESKESLSDETKNFILDSAKQYSSNDMAIIDWNSALLIEPDGERDVADLIEFSLTHLLEFRYYDDLLSDNLQELYDSIDSKREKVANFFSNYYSDISEDSSRLYIAFSEFMSRVENSLKTVGDPYLAIVFRTTALKFRFDDWKKGISHKMETLAEITQMLHGEINVRRSHWLEIIVIALIAIELVPLIVNLYQITK